MKMHTGPPLQSDIVDIMLRFCVEPVTLVGDISEMFHQVELSECDQKYDVIPHSSLMVLPRKCLAIRERDLGSWIASVRCSPAMARPTLEATFVVADPVWTVVEVPSRRPFDS